MEMKEMLPLIVLALAAIVAIVALLSLGGTQTILIPSLDENAASAAWHQSPAPQPPPGGYPSGIPDPCYQVIVCTWSGNTYVCTPSACTNPD